MRQSVDALAPHGARTTTRCDNRGAERERETRGAVWDFWRRRDVGCEGAATKLPANKRERERGKRCDNWLRVKRIEKRCFVCARDRVRKVSRVPDPRLSATVYGWSICCLVHNNTWSSKTKEKLKLVVQGNANWCRLSLLARRIDGKSVKQSGEFPR